MHDATALRIHQARVYLTELRARRHHRGDFFWLLFSGAQRNRREAAALHQAAALQRAAATLHTQPDQGDLFR